jgi:hypothetical protein
MDVRNGKPAKAAREGLPIACLALAAAVAPSGAMAVAMTAEMGAVAGRVRVHFLFTFSPSSTSVMS